MAIERPPHDSVGDRSYLRKYRPSNEEIARFHVVKPGKWETLESVARANGLTTKQLVAFNFPGSVVNGSVDSAIVNWYLHYHAEMNCPETRNKKNRMFVGGEKLAIPWRVEYIEFDEPLIVEGNVLSPAPAAIPNVWFGGGYKAGTTFAVVGIETTQIVCVRSDGKKGFTATVSGKRFPAAGFGASGGPVLVFITSMKSPGQLQGLLSGGTDFSIAIGGKYDAVLRGPKTAKAIEALSRFASKYGKAGEKALKASKSLVKYNGQIQDVVKLLGMKFDHYEPQVFSVGSPWGGFGLEASIHFTVSDFTVEKTVDF